MGYVWKGSEFDPDPGVFATAASPQSVELVAQGESIDKDGWRLKEEQ